MAISAMLPDTYDVKMSLLKASPSQREQRPWHMGTYSSQDKKNAKKRIAITYAHLNCIYILIIPSLYIS